MARLRYLFVMTATIISFFFVIVTWLPAVFFYRRLIRIYTAPVGWVYRVFFALIGVKVKVTGAEHIDPERGFVVISNHQSYLDIPLIIGWVRPTVFLAKKELFDIPLFGKAILWGRCLPVHRGHPRKNKELPLKMQKNIQLGSNYSVFPEGTRSIDGKILPFKTGIFKYLLDKPVPVLPVTLRNSFKIMPKKGMRIFGGTLEIVVHPVIEPETYAEKNADEFKDQVFETIRSAEWKTD